MRYDRAIRAALIFITMTFISAGCGVEGIHRDLMRYEPKDDSFEFFHLWTKLNCRRVEHVDYVQSLWERRHSIIVIPVRDLFSVAAIERRGNNTFRWIDLKGVTDNLDQSMPGMDLDSVQVNPGVFYLDRDESLCWFQEALIPGKVMDALLVFLADSIADSLATGAKHDLEIAANGNQQRPTWDALRKEMLLSVAEMAGVEPTDTDVRESLLHSPLDQTSLSRLRDAKTRKAIKLSRNRSMFSLTIPFSIADTREVIATFDLFQTTLAQHLKNGAQIKDGIPELAAAVSLKDVQKAGLEISIDFVQAAKAASRFAQPEPTAEPDEEDKANSAKTVKWIQLRGIPVQSSFSIDDKLAKYQVK